MKTRIISLALLLVGIIAPSARAQIVPPVLTVEIIEIDVQGGSVSGLNFTSAGSGYTADPTATITGGNPSQAATITVHEVNGSIVTVPKDINNPLGYTISMTGNVGYQGTPTVVFSGGQMMGSTTIPVQASATVAMTSAGVFQIPFQNEAFGAVGAQIAIGVEAFGIDLAGGYVYTLYANGEVLGVTTPAEPLGTPAFGGFSPPQPGIYNLTATTTAGSTTATAATIRYFAIGTAIVSPEASSFAPFGGGPGSLVPVGSSLVVQAAAQSQDSLISRIDFYTDWTGSFGSTTPAGTLIGSQTNYPYSVYYTPAGPAGTVHVVKAIAYDNSGNPVPPGLNGLDQMILTMTVPNPSGLPSCQLLTPTNNASVPIPDYNSSGTANIPVIVTANSGSSGATIAKVDLYVNGVLFGTVSAYPYTFKWMPTVTGTYKLIAFASDSLGNVVASTSAMVASPAPIPNTVTVQALPAVAITSPVSGGTLNSGSTGQVSAVASDTNAGVTITQVQFFEDGSFIGSSSTPVTGNQYTITFTPTQNVINGQAVPSTLSAIATDSLGYTGTSPQVSVEVTAGGTGTNVIVGTPPTIALNTPVAQSSVVVNTPVTLSGAANAPNGNIVSVSFLVNGKIIQTVSQYPYSATWTPLNLGTYSISAAVVDNLGDKVTSTPISVNVVPEPPPTITLTAPSSGGILPVGQAVTLGAGANSPSGTIASVQFFENGISIGTTSSQPYTIAFTPQSTGVYTFTAIATDNSGETNTSTPSIVLVVPQTGGVGNTTYFGQSLGLKDSGRFAFAVVDGTDGVFIGHNSAGSPVTTTFLPGLPVNSGGSFNSTTVNGMASVTGVSGTLAPSNDQFIGTVTQAGSSAVTSGLFEGSLLGQAGSDVTAIVGADGEIMVAVNNGGTSDSGNSSVDSTGAFTINTVGGNTITGKVDPNTGFFTGTISGNLSGSILGAGVSNGTFSDGVMKNLSTRGQVGTGGNIMIAGFVVQGAPKQLLIRAIGPTLASYGVTGVIPSTQLSVYSGSTLVASNTGWSSTPTNKAQVANADAIIGAFALPSGSADSAIVQVFPPGAYTAIFSGLGADTGVGLVEVYDLDPLTAFTSKKLVNVSTRGSVGTGDAVMIVGFNINGATPKRLLIRGAGPVLGSMGVTGALSASHLQLMNSTGGLIRENFKWETGNDATLVESAQSSTGAFAFPTGSSDAAILIVLPPGTYTAVLSGASSSTGVGLVEVYEVP